MNMKKLMQSVINLGYLECSENSKLYRIGKKIAAKRNRQIISGQYLKPLDSVKRDPIWLSVYDL